jgi:Raf kinase inhibitor-like YbhB/YbcL family protein
MTIEHATKSLVGHLLRPIHAGDDKLTSHATVVTSALVVKSSDFSDGGPIPKKYSQESAENLSPSLAWSGVPDRARELVLLCEDPDAPMAEPFLHWLAFGIPPRLGGLPDGVPTQANLQTGIRQALNDGKTRGYTGPMPPIGHGVHHYHFQLFALDTELQLPADVDRKRVVEAMMGHVMAQGEIVGTYERK